MCTGNDCGARSLGGMIALAAYQGFLTRIQGGSWGDVFEAAAISLANSEVWQAANTFVSAASWSSWSMQSDLVHGVVGGTLSVAEHSGSFQSGFVGGFLNSAVTAPLGGLQGHPL